MDDRPRGDGEPLQEGVRTRRRRHEFWQREGERPLARNLALIGSLGALIVVPTLVGMFIGRWLDRTLDAGVFWTVSLLFGGLCAGCYMAWKRIDVE